MKKCNALVLASVLILAELNMTACSNKTDIQTVEDTSTYTSSSLSSSVETEFVSDKEIYSDDKLEIICNKITSEGIEFQAVNKTERDLMLILRVSLDGILQSTWCDGTESTIMAGESKEFTEYFKEEHNSCNHKTMSLMCTAFLDGVEYTSFEVSDVDIGGESNPDQLSEGDVIYRSDDLEVEFVGLTAWGVSLKVDNKDELGFRCSIRNMIINGDIEAHGSAFEIPGHSVGICEHNITYYTDITGDDIQSFTATFIADYDGAQESFNFSYDDGKVMSDAMPVENESVSEIATSEEENLENSTVVSDSNNKNDSTEGTNEISITEQSYVAATNLTKADLTGSKGNWSYKGIKFLPEDCDWIDDNLNASGSVNQGAIYRKIAYLLDGFDLKVTNLLEYSELLTGTQLSSRDEMVPYVENLQTFIIHDEGPEIVAIMKKLEQNSFVSGTFDYSEGTLGSYSVDITDLKQCAEELNTSEEMLGYILAKLSEYAPEIVFRENSCHIEYTNKSGF